VWSTAAPIMIEDVGRDPTYERAEVALEAGLRSAVAFPIVVRGEVSGVLDFVGRGVVGREGEPLEMLAAIGRHLGLYFDRKRADAERQELEGQLRQSQRMEAIGALSGGIAHDFNNILGAIVGNVELALEDVGEGHPALQSLSAIGQASQHARELVQQILTFAQQGRVERRVVSLAPVAAESVGMLRATLPAGVELTLQCDPDCPLVLADVTQVQQVIVNLGTNAWHALQDRAGTIEVSLAAVTVDEAQARRLPGLRPGLCALLTVSDSGNGIEAAMLERIFDPFFTTKAHGNGNGTGLGLSVVHGIVQRHEGAILVSSVLGRGSSFEIYLPAVDGHATEADAWTPRSSLHGNGEHVMFVDDQDALVALADRMLPRLGYEVTSFTDAKLALDAFAADPDGFAVVVTDMNMPHLSGLEVTAQLHKLRPDVPVVLLSGYVAPELLEQAQRQGLCEVVSKPVDRRALGEALHRALHPLAD
jgi:signal transduction histidine kinase/ActR/RegA family two-component response regulator